MALARPLVGIALYNLDSSSEEELDEEALRMKKVKLRLISTASRSGDDE